MFPAEGGRHRRDQACHRRPEVLAGLARQPIGLRGGGHGDVPQAQRERGERLGQQQLGHLTQPGLQAQPLDAERG